MTSKLSAVIGLHWGDEGKGKLVDILAGKTNFVARFAGGANAGHTIHVGEKKFVLHQLPSGVLHPQTKNVIGNGCVVHLPTLIEEIEEIEQAGISLTDRLFISDRAALLFDFHKELDGLKEAALGKKAVGTTKRGIGPAYRDKIGREGFRLADLADWPTFAARLRERLTELNETYKFDINIESELTRYEAYSERISGMIADTGALLSDALESGKTVLAEGAQGSQLDIDHGTYPFVTSSTTTAGNIFTGLGIAPQPVEPNIGVVKAYTTRVGAGPFPTELEDADGERLREIGHEFGATTGRPRRCGWLDLVATKYAIRLNGTNAINITKLDVLNDFAEIKICTGYELNGEKISTPPAVVANCEKLQPIYETLPGWQADTSAARAIKDLPENAQKYIQFVEQFLGVPVRWVGVGVDREAMAS
jgi:adenylosuccinate synthase